MFKTFPGTYYEGAFYQPLPIQNDDFNTALQGIRGIVIVDDTLWVADEDSSTVTIVATKSGKIKGVISVGNTKLSQFNPELSKFNPKL